MPHYNREQIRMYIEKRKAGMECDLTSSKWLRFSIGLYLLSLSITPLVLGRVHLLR